MSRHRRGRLHWLAFGVGLPDYVMTCPVAVLHLRVRLLCLGLFFPLVRVIDSAISLSALAVAWFARSNGTWKSPPRRAIETQPARLPVPVSARGENADDSPGIARPARLWPGTGSCIVMSTTARSHGTLVP